MRAIEFKSQTDSAGNLEISYPLNTIDKKVRVIVFIEDENEEEEKIWLQSISKNSAFDFLKNEEDIYSLNDGKSI